ncbi:MAG: tetratricopeptide repeat protein [Bacteroidota bacterium]
MGKIINFPITPADRLGFRKAKRRKKIDLEELGQLNLFDQGNTAKTIQLAELKTPFNQALAHDENDEYDQAKEFYLKAVEINDNKVDAYCNLGILESKKNNISGAIDLFSKCLAKDSRHFTCHYNLANVYSEIGNLPLAKVHYEVCINISPDFSNSYYNLGLVLALNDEYHSAMHAFYKYKKLTPDEDHLNVDKLLSSLQKTLIEKAQ